MSHFGHFAFSVTVQRSRHSENLLVGVTDQQTNQQTNQLTGEGARDALTDDNFLVWQDAGTEYK